MCKFMCFRASVEHRQTLRKVYTGRSSGVSLCGKISIQLPLQSMTTANQIWSIESQIAGFNELADVSKCFSTTVGVYWGHLSQVETTGMLMTAHALVIDRTNRIGLLPLPGNAERALFRTPS